MERVFNFSAGPSAIPEDVLLKAQKDLFNYPGAGCSVLEMSHRSASFQEIIDNAEATLRRIMNIPEDYAVLFMQGGATLQFSAVAMNLAKQGQKSAYAVTGQFSKKAFAEGKRWTDAVKVADSSDENFSYIPDITADMVPQTAAYFHICANNTIYGTTWWRKPETGAVPFVADWSSAILGVEMDEASIELLAKRSRGTPRVANRLLKRVRDFSQVKAAGVVDTSVVSMTLYALRIDSLGLDSLDRRILEFIITKYNGGPVGIDTISASLGEERVTIEDVCEPYLMQLGLLQRTPKGRMVSNEAYRVIGLSPDRNKKDDDGEQQLRLI